MRTVKLPESLARKERGRSRRPSGLDDIRLARRRLVGPASRADPSSWGNLRRGAAWPAACIAFAASAGGLSGRLIQADPGLTPGGRPVGLRLVPRRGSGGALPFGTACGRLEYGLGECPPLRQAAFERRHAPDGLGPTLGLGLSGQCGQHRLARAPLDLLEEHRAPFDRLPPLHYRRVGAVRLGLCAQPNRSAGSIR